MTVEARVRIGARDDTGRAFSSLGRRLGRLRESVTGLGGKLALLAGGLGLGLVVSRSFELAKAADLMSSKLGISAEALTSFQYAASKFGVEGEAAADILEQMNIRITEYSKIGTGEAADFFEATGLSVKEFEQLDPIGQINKMASAMDGMPRNQKILFLDQMTGGEGVKLVEALDNSATGLKSLSAEGRGFGAALKSIEIKKLSNASKAASRVGGAFSGLGNSISLAFAPLIESGSDWFSGLFAGAGGFRDFFSDALRGMVRVAGFFADRIQGLSTVFRLAALGAAVLRSKFLDAMEGMGQGAVDFLNFFGRGANKIGSMYLGVVKKIFSAISSLSSSPIMSQLFGGALAGAGKLADSISKIESGLKSATTFTADGIATSAANARESLVEMNTSLFDAVNAPPFSDGMLASFDSMIAKSDGAARAAAAAKSALAGGEPLAGVGSVAEKNTADQDKVQLQSQLDTLRDSFLSELDLEKNQFAEKTALNDEFLAKKLESDAEHKLLKESLEQAHQSKLIEIEGSATKKRLDLAAAEQRQKMAATKGFFSNVASAMTGGSRKMFEVAKTASIATALVKGGEAIQSAYAAGNLAGGPIIGGAFAVAAGLAAAKNVANIRKQKFGGGGAISASSSSVPSASGDSASSSPPSQSGQQAVQQPQNVIQFIGDWSGVSRDSIDQVMEGITEKINDGGAVLFGPGSEQAAALKS